MKRFLALGTVFLLNLGLASYAEETAPKKPWKDAGELSLVTANGNSKATTMSAKNTFTYDWTKTMLEIMGSGMGSQNGDHVTAEQYNASEKTTYKIHGDSTYLYQRFVWDSNRFAGYRNRWDGSAGVGHFLLNGPRHKLNAELGGGYTSEDRILVPNENFGSGRAYSKYLFAFTDKSSFSQDAEYLHNFKNADGYRLNMETALTASINSNLALKTSFTWNHVGMPPPDTVKDDTKTSVALVITY